MQTGLLDNSGGGVDDFEVVVNVYDSNGNLFKSYKYDYGQNFANWTYDQDTETFNQNYLTPSYFGNVEILVTRTRHCWTRLVIGK